MEEREAKSVHSSADHENTPKSEIKTEVQDTITNEADLKSNPISKSLNKVGKNRNP